MLIRRSKIAIAAAVAASALTVVPASPASAAVAPCRVAPLFGVTGGRQLVTIAGAYTAAATDVELTCHAVVYETVYASASEDVPGPVAVVAGTGWVPWGGEVTACYTLRVDYLTGPRYLSDCP